MSKLLMSLYRNRLLAFAVVGVALNLRPALAVLGPLLDPIETATGMTHAQAGLLTALPVFVMGLFALTGGRVSALLGERVTIAASVGLVALACATRGVLTDRIGLLATAIAAGVGIALAQAVLPGLIKRRFGQQASRVLGLYTTGIMGGAAIAAAAAADLARNWSWPFALAVWALPAAVALVLWLLWALGDTGGDVGAVTTGDASSDIWNSLRAWMLMVFFGIGTGAYTLVLAWLPAYYTSLGWSAEAAGFLLGGVTVAEVLAGLVVSALIDRFPDRRGPLFVALGLILSGLLVLVTAPLSGALVAAPLLGLGIGALFPLSLILAVDEADDPQRAGRLAAFVQGGGYIIASFTPLLAGLLRDGFSDLRYAWASMAGATLLLFLLGSQFSRSNRGASG